MPLEYLREIGSMKLPMTVESLVEIDKLRVLRAADLVAVLLPGLHSENQSARLLAITEKGREFLQSSEN